MFDLRIINGTVIDGTGGPRSVVEDICIEDGRIVYIGPPVRTGHAVQG